MHLLNVTQSYYPFMDKGGPTFKARSLVRGMAAAGHEVTVLTADPGFDTAMQEIAHAVPSRWGFEAKEGGVKVIYLRTSARYRALTWNPGVAEVWKERLSSFGLVHIYGLYDLIGSALPARAAASAGPTWWNPWGCFSRSCEASC
jgi:hypothetical protein